MRWIKRGLVFVPDGRYDWMQSFAQVPRGLLLHDRLRMYFTCRPRPDAVGNYVSLTGYVDLDICDPTRVLEVCREPVMPLGGPGTFDCHGIMPGTAISQGKEIWMYYTGWNRTVGVPYHQAIGLAVSRDHGKTFERTHAGPVISRTREEGYLQNGPLVILADGLYHMWYSSGTGWITGDAKMECVYVLMHATSRNGIEWQREGQPCMPFVIDNECQNCPTVAYFDGAYHMWFCYRPAVDFRRTGMGYRLAYATSSDLLTWRRDDEAGDLPLSVEGWDSEMICYPWVQQIGGTFHLFYCGNGMGKAGFGFATLESSEIAGKAPHTEGGVALER